MEIVGQSITGPDEARWPKLILENDMLVKHNIEHKGKLYGYWLKDGKLDERIRSESNPFKTPYLTPGSKVWLEVAKAIQAAHNL